MLPTIHQYLCGEDDYKFLPSHWRNSTFATLPHVTECTQHVELSWAPFIFLLVFSPSLLLDLFRSQNGKLRTFTPITLRIYICIVLVFDLTISLLYNLANVIKEEPDAGIYLFGDIPQYLGACAALVFLYASKNRGLVTSGVLFNYWLLCCLCGFTEFRYIISLWWHGVESPAIDQFRFFLYAIGYPLYILELILSCFADLPERNYGGMQSSFLSQITFNWFTPLARLGYKKSLDKDDLWNLNDRDKTWTLLPNFMTYFQPQHKAYQEKRRAAGNSFELKEKEFPSILKPIFQTYKMTFLAAGFYKLIFDLLQFASPHLLKQLITFIQDHNQPVWVGVAIAMTMFIVALLQSMVLHQYFHDMFRLGMNIRSVLTSAVYKKALLLSNNARKNRNVGEIVNLMTVDIQRVQDMTTFVMLFWSAPLQVTLSIYFLWRLLGFSVLVGVLILILMIPLNIWISMKMRTYQQTQMKYKDERLKMMSEILNGVKVLKLYAWEKSMEQMVLEIRMKEIRVLKELAFLNAATTLSWSCAPFLVAVLTFGVYVTVDPVNNVLTPQITFVALTLFNIMRFPLAIFAMIYTQALQCHVSNNRLKGFFAEQEMEPQLLNAKDTSEDAIRIDQGNFTWESSEENPLLKNLSLSIPRGSLVAIVGKVGSGKSSLFSAMLGEMNRVGGHVDIMGNIAYVPQQAWIQNMSLRDNILFNKPFDREFYDRVIECCALKPDLATLPAEDMTEIGEKGINLSGGQKQRISLARSVYSGADILLLDDPLSAVDAHVGKHIFEQVISSDTGVLKHTTRILITHGLHFLKYCDQIVVMKDGRISEKGSYQELMKSQGAFGEFLEEYLVEEAKTRGRSVSFGEDSEDVSELLNEIEKVAPEKRKRIESQISQVHSSTESLNKQPPTPIKRKVSVAPSLSSPKAKEELGKAEKEEVPSNDEKKALLDKEASPVKGKLVEKEGMETGKVKWTVYTVYLAAIGYGIAALFLGVYIFSSVLGVFSNLWLARWSDDAKKIQGDSNGENQTRYRLLVYAGLGVGQACSICAASIIMALGMVRASRILHEGFLENILHSPMSFFDTTPLGRILNRFGKDIDMLDSRLPSSVLTFVGALVQAIAIAIVSFYATPSAAWPSIGLLVLYHYLRDVDAIDATLPRSLLSFTRIVLNVAEILIVLGWASPIIIPSTLPLAALYALLLRFYVSTSRQLKRLESTTRSPIYSHFQESIQGASSIRAYNVVDKFIQESATRVDDNLATYYPSIVANRWLAVRLELIGNMIVLFAALFAALFRDTPGLTAGLVGLSVSYALNITQTLNWAVRMTSELETNIVAVERIKEYTETPREGMESNEIPEEKDWPRTGEIIFKDLSLRYRSGLDLVLYEVNATIKPSEKIGIVGRTGAGKSSLTLALFRIIEAEKGIILIDNVDIAKLKLERLRSRLTVVPQDPVLFSGTLRMNLDPFKTYTDAEIWQALDNAHLGSFVGDLQEKLSHQIQEGGGNLSVGQRQLLCLARALLRKTKILILDEAAAAVDMETDALIQKTIKEQFSECTVLTIAHRLNTVMDSDRLMVLERGSIVEFDAPRTLLENKNGVFYSMAKDAQLV
ncbi:unnamed protein product, partial [Mesorhabditis spiculigera]